MGTSWTLEFRTSRVDAQLAQVDSMLLMKYVSISMLASSVSVKSCSRCSNIVLVNSNNNLCGQQLLTLPSER